MAGVSTTASAEHGVAFLVSAGIVYEIIAAVNSSPQTTEINAKKRGPTLMKYVNLGMGQSALFVIIAAMLDEKHRLAILLGGFLAGGIMYGQYRHALKCGLRSDESGTEDY